MLIVGVVVVIIIGVFANGDSVLTRCSFSEAGSEIRCAAMIGWKLIALLDASSDDMDGSIVGANASSADIVSGTNDSHKIQCNAKCVCRLSAFGLAINQNGNNCKNKT